MSSKHGVKLQPLQKKVLVLEVVQRYNGWLQENDVKIIMDRNAWVWSEAMQELDAFAQSNATEAAIGAIKAQANIDEPEARKLFLEYKSVIDALQAYKTQQNLKAQVDEGKKMLLAGIQVAKDIEAAEEVAAQSSAELQK